MMMMVIVMVVLKMVAGMVMVMMAVVMVVMMMVVVMVAVMVVMMVVMVVVMVAVVMVVVVMVMMAVLAGYSPWGCRESDTTERLTHTLGCRMKHNLYTKKLKYSSEHIVIYIELVFLLQPLFLYSLFSSHS